MIELNQEMKDQLKELVEQNLDREILRAALYHEGKRIAGDMMSDIDEETYRIIDKHNEEAVCEAVDVIMNTLRIM